MTDESQWISLVYSIGTGWVHEGGWRMAVCEEGVELYGACSYQ